MALFWKTPGAIMIGTEFALHYFFQKVTRSAIVSFDSLFSIPNFRLSEKIIHLVASLRALTEQEFILQTKNKEDRILSALASGNLLGLYRDELEERKALRYPPFATLIKITYRGSESDVEAKKEMLADLLKDYNPDIMNAFIKKMKGSYSTNALIKIDSSAWTLPGLSREGTFDTTLENLLRSLPPSFSVHVDPEDIL
jgi:primosomal protein N' (replication factor Y)